MTLKVNKAVKHVFLYDFFILQNLEFIKFVIQDRSNDMEEVV